MSNTAADLRRATSHSVLVEGDTCWRRAHADRAAVLVDAAQYFGALRTSLLKAKKSIYILGWELNSRTLLMGDDEPHDGAPREIGKLLKWLLKRNKQLQIKILLWDHTVFYSPQRELFPRWIFGWRKSKRVEILLDAHLPYGASHHEKVVIIDDRTAYCGGMDLTLRRWDTRDHRPVEPRRCDPKKRPYVPVHDVQMVVDSEAAESLAERARERWAHAGGKPPLEPVTGGADCWPDGIEPDFENAELGIIRTIGAIETPPEEEIREVERSTVAAIASAEKLVYIENQYITSKAAAEALLARMRANPSLEAIVLTSCEPGGWLEAGVMGVGRQQFMALFDEPHLTRRIHFVYPFARGKPGDEEYKVPNKLSDGTFSIHVHAKVLVIDDTFLRIGSSNLNNRSMGFDTECDIGIEGSTPEERGKIAAIRNRLMAEHWGIEPDSVDRALGSGEPVFDALQAAADLPAPPKLEMPSAASPNPSRAKRWRARVSRALRGPGRTHDHSNRGVGIVAREQPVDGGIVQLLGDPETTVTADKFMDVFAGGKRRRPLLRGALIGVGTIAAIALVIWAVSMLYGSGISDRVGDSIVALRGNPWRVPLVLLAFVAGSIVSFPILVMIGATILALGPLLGFVCAAAGSLLAASVTFGIGRAIGRKPLRRWLGRRAQQLEEQIEGRGIIAVALIRKVPIAPFTIVNMLVGASGLSFREFILGTAIGMLPGIAAFAIVGERAMDLWHNPTPQNIALIVGAIVLWIGVVLGLQRVMNRFVKK